MHCYRQNFRIPQITKPLWLCAKLFFILILLSPNSSLAQSNSCLTDVVGKKLVWNAHWSTDGKDEGTTYKIIRATELKKNEIVMFELSGPETSYKSTRDLLIQNKELMNAVCKNIDSGSISDRFSDTRTIKEETDDDKSEIMKLPFIRYGKSGWERADTPMNENLTSCGLLGKSFSCTASDKKAHFEQLKELEDEVQLMDDLGY